MGSVPNKFCKDAEAWNGTINARNPKWFHRNEGGSNSIEGEIKSIPLKTPGKMGSKLYIEINIF